MGSADPSHLIINTGTALENKTLCKIKKRSPISYVIWSCGSDDKNISMFHQGSGSLSRFFSNIYFIVGSRSQPVNVHRALGTRCPYLRNAIFTIMHHMKTMLLITKNQSSIHVAENRRF